MAGTNVGKIELGVDIDGKGVKGRVKVIGQVAGKQFEAAFSKDFLKGLDGTMKDVRSQLSTQFRSGGKEVMDSLATGMRKHVRSSMAGLEDDIAKGLATGNWDAAIKSMGGYDQGVEKLKAHLKDLDKTNGQLKRSLGVTYKEVDADIDKHVKKTQESKKATTDNKVATIDLTEAHKKLSESVRGTTSSLNAMLKKKLSPKSRVEIEKQRDAYMALGEKIRGAGVDLRKAFAGADKDQEKIKVAIKGGTDEIVKLQAELETLDGQKVEPQVEVKTPTKAELVKKGFFDGRTFGNAFEKGVRSASGSGGGSLFDKIRGQMDQFKNRWNEFLTAFPAGVTVIGRAATGVAGAFAPVIFSIVQGLAAGITALASSAAGALVALGGTAAAVLPGIAFGAILAVNAFKKFNDGVGVAGKALERFKSSWENNDLATFIDEWEGSLAKFLDTLRVSLEDDSWAEGLGKSFSTITDAFTGVLESPAWNAFREAMNTSIPNSIANIGLALAPVFEGMMIWIAAISPMVEEITGLFIIWGNEFKGAIQAGIEDGSLIEFFKQGKDALVIFGDLLQGLGEVFGTIFEAGIGPGNEFLRTIKNMVEEFGRFLNSTEGQQALADFFQQGLAIMNSLLPVIGELGRAFATLVTPETTGAVIRLFDALVPIIPVIADLLATVANAGIIDVFTQALTMISEAIQPIIPILGEFMGVVGTALMDVLVAISPIITVVADVIGILLQAIQPILPVIVTLIEHLAAGLAPVFEAIGPIIQMLSPILLALAEALLPIIDSVLALVEPLMNALMPVFEALAPVVLQLAEPLMKLILALTPVGKIIVLIGALAPILEPILGVISKVLVSVVNFIGKFTPVIGFIIDMVANFLALNGVFGFIGKAIGKVGQAFGTLSRFLGNIGKVFGEVGGKFGDFIRIFAEIPAKFIQIGADIIAGLLQGITAAWLSITTFFTDSINGVIDWVKGLFGISSPSTVFQEIGDFLIQGLLNGITTAWTAIVDFFTGIGETVKGWFNGAIDWLSQIGKDVLQGLMNGITWVWDNVIMPYVNFAQKVKGWFTGAIDWLKQIGKDILQGLFNGIKFVWDAQVTTWSKIGEKVKGWFDGAINWLKTSGKDIMTGLWNAITTAWWAAVKFFDDVEDKVKGWFSGALTWLKQIGSDIIGGLFGGIQTMWDNSVTAWTNISGTVKGWFNGAKDWLFSSGKDIVTGLGEGIGSMASTIGRFFLDKLPSWIVGPFKKAMGIASPSTVFKEYGVNLVEGLILGVAATKDDLLKQFDTMNKAIDKSQAKAAEARAKEIVNNRRKENEEIRRWNSQRGKGVKARPLLPSIPIEDARKTVAKEFKEINKTIDDAQKKFQKEQMKRKFSIRDVFNVDNKGMITSIKNAGRLQRATMGDLVAFRERLAANMEVATKNLEDAMKMRSDFAKSVKEGAIQFASAMNTVVESGKKVTATDVVGQMTKSLQELKTFKANVEALRKAGLNENTLQEIVAGGVQGGGDIAAALAAGGADVISEVNSLQSSINTTAGNLGKETAGWFFDAGVESAQGIVDGLKSMDAQVVEQMKKTAKAALDAFKKALGIKSPSTVFAALGRQIPAGIAVGIKGGTSEIAKALRLVTPTATVQGKFAGFAGKPNPMLPGKFGNGTVGGVHIAPGAIQIVTPTKDPALVASMVLDSIARQAK